MPTSADHLEFSAWQPAEGFEMVPPGTPLTQTQRAALEAFMTPILSPLETEGCEPELRFDPQGRLVCRNRNLPPGHAAAWLTGWHVARRVRHGLAELGLTPPPPELTDTPTVRILEPPRQVAPAVANRMFGRVRAAVSGLLGGKRHAAPLPTQPSGPDSPVEGTASFHALQQWLVARWRDGTFLPALLRWAERIETCERLAQPPRLGRTDAALIASAVGATVESRLGAWFDKLASSPDPSRDVLDEMHAAFLNLADECYTRLRTRAQGHPT